MRQAWKVWDKKTWMVLAKGLESEMGPETALALETEMVRGKGLESEMGPEMALALETEMVRGKGLGDDVLNGQKQDDLVKGRKGNDQLRGHSGNDTLHGGQGNDTINGGRGADQFRISKGSDHILDFKPHRGDTLQRPASASLQFIQNNQHLVLLDPSFNIHTTLHNTSLDALLKAQPELLS